MEIIILQKSTDRLSLKEGQLVHTSGDEVIDRHPICATELVQVYGNGQITTQALKECLKEGVRVNYFSAYGTYLGRLEPGYPKNVRRRLGQYRVFFDEEKRLALSKSIVEAKIHGELVELRRLLDQGHSFPAKEMRRTLREGMKHVRQSGSIAELRGVEGFFAKAYYNIFKYVLPRGIKWTGRSYHPAEDGFNVLLSYVYAIAAQAIREAIENHSLDPACSYLHEPDYGRGGLSYDLLELFRALLCDNFAVRFAMREASFCDYFGNAQKGEMLPEEIRCRVQKKMKEELTKVHGVQKKSPGDQIHEVVMQFATVLESGEDVLNFSQFLPVR